MVAFTALGDTVWYTKRDRFYILLPGNWSYSTLLQSFLRFSLETHSAFLQSPVNFRYCLCVVWLAFSNSNYTDVRWTACLLIGFCENGLHLPETAYGQRRLFNASHGLCSVRPCWRTSHCLRLASGTSVKYMLEWKVFRIGTTAGSQIYFLSSIV